MSSRMPVLSPHYNNDLRALIDEAFSSIRPVPTEPVPGGTIGERIKAPPPVFQPTLVTYREDMLRLGHVGEVRIVAATEYWMLALPHRFLILGPLLDVAYMTIERDERLEMEPQILGLYRDSYHCVPLPPAVLSIIRQLTLQSPKERLAAWLDAAREEIMSSPTMEAALDSRKAFRLEALRHGAGGKWGERSVAVAELLTDIFVLCRAVREDVERASLIGDRFAGSVSLALLSLDEAADTTFERTLASLLRPALTAEDVDEEEREELLRFAARRTPYWSHGLLPHHRAPTPATIRRVMNRHNPSASYDSGAGSSGPSETAAECYRRILRRLEEQIIARPELCRRLALVGLAHLHGVTHQRVLLCGPSGSGKTHAARALAEAIGRLFVQVDTSDVTATGWKGLNVPDLLRPLMWRAGGKLDGAVLLLDEIDKARIGRGVEGNSVEAKANLQASLLALLDGQPVTPDSSTGAQMDTSRLLVIGTGAFGGRFSTAPPSTPDLVRWGWTPEFAARWGERLVLNPPGRSEAIDLLRSSERSVGRRLGPMLDALGIEIEVPEEVLAYTADIWLRTRSDFRSAAEWIVSAARRRLIEALEQGGVERIELAPDDIVPPRPSDGGRRPYW